MARDNPPLDGLDLNLLVTLRALLREGSVTRAAARLGQTQPTVSRALAVLRVSFEDPLLVRSGRGMACTPRAEALRAPLERLLASTDLLAQRSEFVSAQTQRTFRLTLPDILGAQILGPLQARLFSAAPGLTLQVFGTEKRVLGALLEREVDLQLGAIDLTHPELYTRRVGAPEPWAVVLGRAHPAWGQALSLESWLAAPHLRLVPGGRPDEPGIVDRLLTERGLERRVHLHMSYVAGLGAVLAQSGAVASLPLPLARALARDADLEMHPHPLGQALPGIPLRMTWHALTQEDPGHAWFRREVAEVVEALLRTSPSGHP